MKKLFVVIVSLAFVACQKNKSDEPAGTPPAAANVKTLSNWKTETATDGPIKQIQITWQDAEVAAEDLLQHDVELVSEELRAVCAELTNADIYYDYVYESEGEKMPLFVQIQPTTAIGCTANGARIHLGVNTKPNQIGPRNPISTKLTVIFRNAAGQLPAVAFVPLVTVPRAVDAE